LGHRPLVHRREIDADHRLDVFGDTVLVDAGYVSKGPAQQVITQEYDRDSQPV
jgi:hypothetical protein